MIIAYADHHPRDVPRRQPASRHRDSPKLSEGSPFAVLGERHFVEVAQPLKPRRAAAQSRGNGSLVLGSQISKPPRPQVGDFGVAAGVPEL